jgi:hypothetical protein
MRHRGRKKAVIAVAHAMLVAIYCLLGRRTTYRDLGEDYYKRRHAERAKRRPSRPLSLRAIASLSNPQSELAVDLTRCFLSVGGGTV